MKHQLAAILYADVAGYSRLSSADELATHQNLAQTLEIFSRMIEEHGGEKINEAGDAILAEFPSVNPAVKAAMDFQTAMAERNHGLDGESRFQYRIGVHLGEIIQNRGDIYGDDVNITARIQGLAEPGGLAISAAVQERVKGQVGATFYDLGFQVLKNIPHSVHVYSASAASLGGADHPVAFLSSQVQGQPLFDLDDPTFEKPMVASGRCLCGNVSFQMTGEPAGAGFCHCRICQRAVGAAVNTWVAFLTSDVNFESNEPTWYQSSPIAERGFCNRCGSSLAYRLLKPAVSRFLIINLPVLDDPAAFSPTWHGGIESQLPWMDIHDALPRMHSRESPALQKAWESVGIDDPAEWEAKKLKG